MSVSLLKYLDRPHVYLDNLRNIATILGSLLIPVAITLASRQRERKRATLETLRRFTLDNELTTRLTRLYLYRLFASGASDAENPYKTDAEMVRDSVFLLNFCDTIAIEADSGLIDSDMLARAIGPTLIGARDVVLRRLQTSFCMETGDAYADFERLAKMIEARQAKRNKAFVTKIPAWKNAEPPAAP